MVRRPTVVFTGPTGSGKSSVIEQLSRGAITGIASDKKQSFTTDVLYYDLKDLGVVYDTPGLGDSEGRDQLFINSMVDTLVKENKGIHRLYFCVFAGETRTNALIQSSMAILYDMFGQPDMSLVKFVLTRMDQVIDDNEEDAIIASWKESLAELSQKAKWKGVPQVIPVGFLKKKSGKEGYPKGFDALTKDIKAVDLSKVIQTEFMKKVQTIETQTQTFRQEAEQAKKNAEAIAKTNQDLQIQILQEKDEVKKQQLQFQQLQATIDQIREEKKAAEAASQADAQAKKMLEAQIGAIKENQGEYQKQITSLQAQLASRPTGGGGGGGSKGGCFDQYSIVQQQQQSGLVIPCMLKDIQVGDKVETVDQTGQRSFQPVLAISRHKQSEYLPMVELVAECTKLVLTATHIVMRKTTHSDSCELVHSCKIQVGDRLWVRREESEFGWSTVLRINSKHAQPRSIFTSNGFVVVDDVAASVHTDSHSVSQLIVSPLRGIAAIAPGILKSYFVDQVVQLYSDYVDPWMGKVI